MIFKFKYKKYHHYKSQNKKESILKKLTNKYENIFLKILNKEELSNEDGILFMKGFEDIKKYLISSLLKNIEKDYDTKKPIEQKLTTLYNQYRFLYPEFDDFMFRIKEDLNTICEGSIYSAIGFGEKSFIKQNNQSNLILFINNMFFYDVLNFLEKNVNSLKNEKFILDESLNDTFSEERNLINGMEIDNLLKEKNILDSLGQDIYDEIKDVLLKEKQIPDHLEEIIKYIKL